MTEAEPPTRVTKPAEAAEPSPQSIVAAKSAGSRPWLASMNVPSVARTSGTPSDAVMGKPTGAKRAASATLAVVVVATRLPAVSESQTVTVNGPPSSA